jgi:N-acetylglucosaminyldiphosphoundecaprenol N-acetyl-beta-D-mannosaminyltransferase
MLQVAGPRAIQILGVPVSMVNMRRATDLIDAWIRRGDRKYVCVRDAHGLMLCQEDARLRAIHRQAGMVTPDGMPLVWIARLRGVREVARVCGPDLVEEVCRLSPKRGYRHFFLGGAPGIAERMAARLQALHPGLIVAGTYAPTYPATVTEPDAEAVRRINASRPDIVWVGLGTPKQEYWMSAHLGHVEAPVMIGVGAAFDFAAGAVSRAPRWMQRAGLEWLHRLVMEPRRLWRRYLILAPKLIGLVVLDSLSHRMR